MLPKKGKGFLTELINHKGVCTNSDSSDISDGSNTDSSASSDSDSSNSDGSKSDNGYTDSSMSDSRTVAEVTIVILKYFSKNNFKY